VLSRQPPAEAPGIRVRGTRLSLPIVERLLQQWFGLAARRQRVATRGVQKYQAVALRSEPQRFVEASGAKPARPTRTPHLARSEGLAVPRRQCNEWARQAVPASAISFVKKWLPSQLLGRRIVGMAVLPIGSPYRQHRICPATPPHKEDARGPPRRKGLGLTVPTSSGSRSATRLFRRFGSKLLTLGQRPSTFGPLLRELLPRSTAFRIHISVHRGRA